MNAPDRRDDLLLPLRCLATVVGAEAVAGLLWIAQGLVAVLTGRGWTPPAFRWGLGALRELMEDRTPRVATLVVFGVLLALVVLVLMQAASRVLRWRRGRERLAEAAAVNVRADVETMTAKARAAETARLHPALASTAPVRRDVVDVLGTVLPSGPEIFSGWEDTEVDWMAPRSGKTTARAIPRLLAAPGPAVATANKPDLYRATQGYRSTLGHCWRFDPQKITRLAKPEFHWNPLRLVVDDESARQLAAQFVQAIVPNGGDRFWADSAADLLSALFLAAALGGKSLREVWRWLNTPTEDYPVRLLEDKGMGPVAESLRNIVFLHPETRDSVYQTARTGASCLRNPRILAWVTPRPGLPEFDMATFVRSTDTMYLMSRDTAGAAAPLLAAFLDQLFDVSQDIAESEGDRLPVPLTLVLDEAANIAPWDRLPKVCSFAGSIGVSITVILQSWAQGEGVWGERGMEMLFGATTVKVFGAGIDDDTLTRRLATAVGKHRVRQRSTTHSADGRSDTVSSQLEDALPQDSVRALGKGTALILATGQRPVIVRLKPWHQASYRDVVEASIAETKRTLAELVRGKAA